MGLLLLSAIGISCSSNEEDKGRNGMSHEEVEVMEENSILNSDEIQYLGHYTGQIKGKEVELIIKDDQFEVHENGKKAYGEWSKVDDGSIIELNPNSGKVEIKHYAFSDQNTWVALTDSLTYIEPEQLLERVSK